MERNTLYTFWYTSLNLGNSSEEILLTRRNFNAEDLYVNNFCTFETTWKFH